MQKKNTPKQKEKQKQNPNNNTIIWPNVFIIVKNINLWQEV